MSANVGDQFGVGNRHLLNKVYNWFYLGINVGSSVSIFLCPILLESPKFGPRYAFGLPGVFMLIATIVFWSARKKFVHAPPGGLGFIKECGSKEGLSALGRLSTIFVFNVIFWALWDQSQGGEWTLQARDLDLRVLGYEVIPAQVGLVNAFFVILFIPLFNFVIYPAIGRFFTLTALRKIGIGLFVTAFSFVIIWWLQAQIDAGAKPTIYWQVLAYAFITTGEVMVYGTGLEFAYTQAPNSMKSAIMAIFLFTTSLGNQFTAAVNFAIPSLKRLGMDLEGAAYFRFYTFLMLAAAIVFVFVSRKYKGKTYLQGAVLEADAAKEALVETR